MSEAEEARAAWDAIDEETRETLRSLGLRPSHEDPMSRSAEFVIALAAWRGLTDEQRQWFYKAVISDGDRDAVRNAMRLLKAASR